MAFRPHGRARVDSKRPQAFGVCDRCATVYNLVDLGYEEDWRGNRIMRTGFRVCRSCMSIPAPFLRTVILPPDPVPVKDPRPLNFSGSRSNDRVTESDDTRVTEADDTRIIE